MNRKFLEDLGLEKEVIDAVMAEHGKTIQELKPAQEELEAVRNEKATLEEKIEELEGTLTSTTEKYASIDQTIEEKERLINEYETKNLKFKIANQAGIPIDLAERLSGETEDEIKADAEKLSEFVNKKPTLPLKPTEPSNTDPTEQAYENMIENLN